MIKNHSPFWIKNQQSFLLLAGKKYIIMNMYILHGACMLEGGLVLNTVSFHLHLLSKAINADKFPFTKMVIDKELTEKEYNALFQLLRRLDEDLKIQKSEGLLDFTSLLIHFAGMLNWKLSLHETIYALKDEGHYPELMAALMRILRTIHD